MLLAGELGRYAATTISVTHPPILDQFYRRERSAELPFVENDEVVVTAGLYAGKEGTVELLAYAVRPMEFLVDFGDGTDESLPASMLRLRDASD